MSEFSVNLEKLSEESKAMEFDGTYFSQSKIPMDGSVSMRLFPGRQNMNGLFYLKETSFWINKKNYVSPITFNESCVMDDFRNQILSSSDDTLKQLEAADNFSKSERYLIGFVMVNELGEIQGEPKIFQCSKSVVAQLNKLITDKLYQNGTPLGLLDFVKGRAVSISKSKASNGFTEYKVLPHPNEKAINVDTSKIIDIVAETRGKIYSDEYLTGVMENYFLGKAMPDDSLKGNSKPKETPKVETPQPAPKPEQPAPHKKTMSLMDRLKQKE